MPAPFVHLHLHTQYSLLDGAIKHNPLFARAKAAGMPAVAQTDHGNLFGTVEFYEKARANGVKPIIGCEVYFAGGSRFDREKKPREDTGFDAINHLLLLAMDATGYQNLMKLVSKAYLEGFYYKPRIDWQLLERHHQGLICTSGCLSAPVPRAVLANESDRAWSLAEDFKRLFGDRYYLEIQRHGIPAQEIVNQELVKMHRDLGVPLVATNDAHYLEAHHHEDHDLLLCVGTAAKLPSPPVFDRLRPSFSNQDVGIASRQHQTVADRRVFQVDAVDHVGVLARQPNECRLVAPGLISVSRFVGRLVRRTVPLAIIVLVHLRG